MTQFFHTHGCYGFSSKTISHAVQGGSYRLVLYLQTQQRLPLPVDENEHGIDTAALSGIIRLVELLDHANASATTAAMDTAAQNSFLDVFKFLHEYRTEGFTTEAKTQAVLYGHLEIVKYLHFHCHVKWPHAAIEDVEANGCADIVRFLREHANA